MKRIFLVILAATIAFTVVLASAGVVGANRGLHTSKKVSINVTTLTAGELTFDYSWEKLGAYSYTIYVFKFVPGSGGNYIYMPGNIPLAGKTTSFSGSHSVTTGVESGYYYQITVYVFSETMRTIGFQIVENLYLSP